MMKQRLFAVLLVFCMMAALVPAVALTGAAADTVSTWDGTVATAFADDSAGTEDDPIEIRSAAEFMYFRNKAAGTAAYYRLTVDVDLASKDVTVAPAAFAGVLDGAGHTVSHLSITEKSDDQGLLGTVTGIVRNLVVDGIKITAVAGRRAGGIAAQLSGAGEIANCTVKDAVLHATEAVGGVVGAMSGGRITGCTVTATSPDAKIYCNGKTVKLGAGGIVGQVTGASEITGCTNAAPLGTDNLANAGGICGVASGNLTLADCRNDAPVQTATAGCSAGGLIGGLYTGNITVGVTGCVNNGVIAANGAGGLVGAIVSGGVVAKVTVSNSANRGAVNGGTLAGGIFAGSLDDGKAGPIVTVTQCASLGSVTAAGTAGGILGRQSTQAKSGSFTMTATYVNAKVSSTGTDSAFAGLAVGFYGGSNTRYAGLTLKDSLFIGTASAATGAGAAVGSSAFALTMTDTYFSGVADLPLVAAGTAVTTDTATDADFSGTTVLDALNAAAVAAELPEDTWVKGQASGKPELKLFCTDPAGEETGPAIPIDGASLTISGNVTLNLYVKVTSLSGMTFDAIYVTDGVNSYQGTQNGENYTFPITGLTAKEFGVNKEYAVQLVTGEKTETSTETVTYSPLQYAINMYGTRTDIPKLDPLLLSIVAYADAATGTTAAKTAFTAKHENADFATLPAYATILAGDAAKDTYTYNAETMPGFAAKLTETVTLKLALDGTAYTDVSATIAGAKLNVVKNGNEVTISGLYATDLYNTITFTFTDGEGAETTATYSLMQYLNSYASDATYGALAQATAVYLYAARNFCLANQA